MGNPFDCSNYWLGEIFYCEQDFFCQLMLFTPCIVTHSFAFFQIAAGGKGTLACARYYQDAQVFIVCQMAYGFVHFF